MALSAKLQEGKLTVVSSLAAAVAQVGDGGGGSLSGKTKDLVALLEARGWLPGQDVPSTDVAVSASYKRHVRGGLLFIDGDAVPDSFARAVSNIGRCKALPARGANVLDIVRSDNLVLTTEALTRLTGFLLQDFVVGAGGELDDAALE